MDFQTHLYELGEIEAYLHTIGFTKVIVYASYEKAIAKNNQTEMFYMSVLLKYLKLI